MRLSKQTPQKRIAADYIDLKRMNLVNIRLVFALFIANGYSCIGIDDCVWMESPVIRSLQCL